MIRTAAAMGAQEVLCQKILKYQSRGMKTLWVLDNVELIS